MMAKKLSFLLLILSLQLSGQSWKFVKRTNLAQEITAGDVGSLGKVYLGTERGNVYSFLPDGSQDTNFSSSIFQPVSSLDASNSLRVFVFYKDVAQFEFLERFSALPRTYHLNDFGVSNADDAFLGSNNTIWLLGDDELIQLNTIDHSVLFRFTSVQSDGEIGLIGKDSEKIRRMLARKTNEFKSIGFDNELKYKVESTYLRVGEQETASRVKWPVTKFSMILLSQNHFHFVLGQEVLVYQLIK